MVPAFKIKRSAQRNNENFQLFPGSEFYVDDMNDIMPFEVKPPDMQAFEVVQALDGQATQLYAAGGYGSLSPKVRKNQEVKAAAAEASSSFSTM